MKFQHKMFNLTDGGVVVLIGRGRLHCSPYMYISVGRIVYPDELKDAGRREGEITVDEDFCSRVHQGLVDLASSSPVAGMEIVCEVYQEPGEFGVRGISIRFPEEGDRIDLFARIGDCIQEAFRSMISEIDGEL